MKNMKKDLIYLILLSFVVFLIFNYGQIAKADSQESVYLPYVSKGEDVNLKPLAQSVGTGQNLIDAVPLSDGTIMVIYNTKNTPEGSYNLSADVYNPDGSFALVSDFWQSSSGLISGAIVKDCGWVVSQGEFGFTVHKIVLKNNLTHEVVNYSCGQPVTSFDTTTSKNGK